MACTVLDLGDQPLVNNLATTREAALAAPRFPLKAVQADDGAIALAGEVDPKLLYQEYLYHSGTSQPFINHCRALFKSISHLSTKVVIDVGGNDGTLLRAFREESQMPDQPWSSTGVERLVNVDASTSFAEVNRQSGIEFHCAYFNAGLDLPRANVITSLNVFQHTKDLGPFLDGVARFLGGVWVLEFPYALRTLQTLQFDQFYHEHHHYHLLGPLEKMLDARGMRIIFAQEVEMHGGSMRLWITNQPGPPAISLDRFLREEDSFDYGSFDAEVHAFCKKTRRQILALPGKTVFFGAAAKGCVFLNALGLSTKDMPDAYVVDDTPAKQGLFIPGTGFQVVSRNEMFRDGVDRVIVLAHNFKDHIARSLVNAGFAGTIHTYLPNPPKR